MNMFKSSQAFLDNVESARRKFKQSGVVIVIVVTLYNILPKLSQSSMVPYDVMVHNINK